MLTGSHAIKKRSNDYDTICSILNDEFPRAKTFNPHLSDQTQEAILKAVDKNMLRRFQTVMEFKSGLFRETVVDPNRVKVSVGRRECDITIPSDYISGHHLEIEYIRKGRTVRTARIRMKFVSRLSEMMERSGRMKTVRL